MTIPAGDAKTVSQSRTQAGRLTAGIGMLVVVGIGAWLRLSHLGVPTLWFDEMFTALMADHSLRYINDFSLTLGLHPPFFYAFVKLVSQMGVSDFALRASFALAGTATVYLAYRSAREFFSTSTALATGLLFAISPLSIWLSRQIRPYVFIVLFFLIAVLLLARWVRGEQKASLAGLIAANAALFSLHFLCFPLVATEICIAFFATVRDNTPARKKFFLRLCLGTVLVGLPSLYYLLRLLTQGNGYVATGAVTYLGMVQNLLASAGAAVFFEFTFPNARFIVLAAALVGAARMLFSRPRAFLFLATLGIVPLVFFLALRFGSAVMPAYVSFLLVPLFCLAGYVFESRARLLPVTNMVVAAVAVVCAITLRAEYARMFETEDAAYASSIFDAGRYKSIAKALPEAIQPGDLVVMADQYLSSAVNWYLRQFLAQSPITRQHLPPDATEAYFDFVGLNDSFSEFRKDPSGLFAELDPPLSVSTADKATVHRFCIARTPITVLDTVPRVIRFTAMPRDAYGRTFSLDGLSLNPFWGVSLIPSMVGQPGTVTYAFDNKATSGAQSIWLWFAYANTGEGNTLQATATFDGEPAQTLYRSTGIDGRQSALVKIERDKPYHRLNVGFSLTAMRRTPTPNLNDLERVELKKVSVYVCDQGDEKNCLTRLYLDVLPQKLLEASDVDQQEVARDNARDIAGTEVGWSHVGAADPTRPATVEFKATSPREQFVFYPRVCGQDGVVNIYEKSGTVRTLLFSLSGLPNACTPIGLQTVFRSTVERPDKTRLFEVELSGKNAEVWHKGTSFVF